MPVCYFMWVKLWSLRQMVWKNVRGDLRIKNSILADLWINILKLFRLMLSFHSPNASLPQNINTTAMVTQKTPTNPITMGSPNGAQNYTPNNNNLNNEESAKSSTAVSGFVPGADEYEICRPVVFQCRNCRTIVGDSGDLEVADPVNKFIVFRGNHPNITIRPEWHWSQEEYSFGSLYQDVACTKCDSIIGVRYHTTNANTDHLRNMFTLSASALFV